MLTAARLLTTALLLSSSAAYDNILISDYKKTKFHLNYTVIKDLAGKDRNGYLAVVSIRLRIFESCRRLVGTVKMGLVNMFRKQLLPIRVYLQPMVGRSVILTFWNFERMLGRHDFGKRNLGK